MEGQRSKEFADPGTYREMAEPHASVKDLDEALDGFHREIAELRKKYRIREVAIITCCSAFGSDGNEAEMFGCMSLGNPLQLESMYAFALGKEQTRRRERIGTLLNGCT